MDLAPIFGLIKGYITDLGKTTTCMASESIFMLMEYGSMENMSMIKRKDMESTFGQTDANMKAGGTKENNMELEFTLIRKIISKSMVCGKTVNV